MRKLDTMSLIQNGYNVVPHRVTQTFEIKSVKD